MDLQLSCSKISEGNWQVVHNKSKIVLGKGISEQASWTDAKNTINKKISSFNVIKHEIDDALQYVEYMK